MRHLRITLATLLLAALPAATRASDKILCFGDSITFGDFDIPEGFGYPGRLQDRLDLIGWDVVVVNSGIGGEKTAEAVTRVDSVLASHPVGDLFLLMEGTNDISRSSYSAATTKFNLDVIAGKAESYGYLVAHSSIIPRYPCTSRDWYQEKTCVLGANARDLSSENPGRYFVDVFGAFSAEVHSPSFSYPWSIDYACPSPDAEDPNYDPNYPEPVISAFEYYYNNYSDPCGPEEDPDPVGHPNSSHGYPLLTDVFEAFVLERLDAGLHIVPPSTRLVGTVLTFGAELYGVNDFTKLEWDFGDGGRATISPVGSDPTIDYMYLAIGTYTVQVHWQRSGGASGTVTRQIEVTGSQPAWLIRTSVVPLVQRGAGPAPDDLRFDLDLSNSSGEPVVADVELLAEPVAGEPIALVGLTVEAGGTPPAVATIIGALRESVGKDVFGSRRFFLADAAAISEVELLGNRFEAAGVRAAAKIRFHRLGGTTGTSAAGKVYRDGFSGTGAVLAERPSAEWSLGARQIAGLTPTAGVELRLSVTNPTARTVANGDIVVPLELYDDTNALVGSHSLSVLRSGTTTATLQDLFPELGSFVAPFRLELASSNRSYLASILAVNSSTGEVLEIPTVP